MHDEATHVKNKKKTTKGMPCGDIDRMILSNNFVNEPNWSTAEIRFISFCLIQAINKVTTELIR